MEIPNYDDLAVLAQRIEELEAFKLQVTQDLLCKHTKTKAWERWCGEVRQSDESCETVLACRACEKELFVTPLHRNGKGPNTYHDKRVDKIGYKMGQHHLHRK